MINALVVALCMKKQNEVVDTLETLEEIWGEYQVYSGDELNPVSGTFSVDQGDRAGTDEDIRKAGHDE